MSEKNYDDWFILKKLIDKRTTPPSFKEREIWWCQIGVNIGYEIFGKSDAFTRPILIIKKYSNHTFLGAPLSTQSPRYKNIHVPIVVKNKTGHIKLDHIRTYDARRLTDRMARITPKQFGEVKSSLIKSIG